MIIIDNNMENFRMHASNGIMIRSWYDDLEDDALVKLAPILVGKSSLSRRRDSGS